MKYSIDLLTGELFQAKRKNQRFAKAANRFTFHNNKAHKEREAKSFIDKPLRHNHKLLMGLIQPNQSLVFSKDFLAGKGFSFFLVTHYEIYKETTCPALYNFIFIDMGYDKNFITIYRKE